MKAYEEIGFSKTIKFVVYAILQCFYSLLILPPLRKLFLILFGAEIGSDSVIMNVKFFNWHQKGLQAFKVGRRCFIGDDTLIDLYDSITLEDEVTLAQRVTILSHLNVGYSNHPLQKYFPKSAKPVLIKKGSVVAATATILPGVTIGSQSFVAAGSVVTKDVPDKTLVAGVPAKPIREIK